MRYRPEIDRNPELVYGALVEKLSLEEAALTASVNVHEAKTRFLKLSERVQRGEEIVIAKAGKPVARIVPVAMEVRNRRPGSARDALGIGHDFDAPLPSDIA